MASILASVVGLIDPPLYSADDIIDEKTSECDGNKSSADSTKINEPCDPYGISPISKISPGDGQITKKKKKVQFNDSSFEKRRKISVHDSIRAYDLLLHIIRIQPLDLSDELLYEKTSWNSLQLYADTYRALIVTSCLLLEMLPTENNHDDFNTTWPRCSPTCPILSPAPSSSIPVLSSSIIQLMLSTSRRCIFILKYLERICAAKSMVDHHKTSGSILFYIGGDDIEDYDRCTNDLHTNYDWHDDGFLPMPGSYKSTDQGTSLIHECCYRPHNLSVQPSSHYEKSASTKEWIRGERLISFSVEDYDYYEDMAYNFDQDAVGDPDNTATGICNEVECRIVSSLQVESRAVDYHHFPNMPYDETENQHVLQKQREDKNINNITQNLHDDSNEGEGTPIFSLSPTALDEAEEKLLDIMVPTVPVKPSSNSISKRTKRRKRKHLQKQVKETTLTQNQICPTSLDWKEGYLLIGFNNQTLPLTMRVYAKVCVHNPSFVYCHV